MPRGLRGGPRGTAGSYAAAALREDDGLVDARRVIGIVILVAAAMVLLLAGWVCLNDDVLDPGDAPYWWRGPQMRGIVQRISDKDIIITTENGPVAFVVDEMTRISMTGAYRYQVGAIVKIKYKDIKTEKLARGIFVLKPDPNAPMPSATPSSSAGSALPHAVSPAPASPSAVPSGTPGT